jgi:hypothetical protein
VSEVDAGIEEVFDCDVHGVFGSVSLFLPKEGTLDLGILTGFGLDVRGDRRSLQTVESGFKQPQPSGASGKISPKRLIWN